MDALVGSSAAPAGDVSAPVPRTGGGSAPVPRTRVIPRRLLRLRSDLALAERFAGGEEYAFALLYERHRKSVLAVCMGVLGSRHDAEDAAQEAFAALALSLRKGPPENLPAWLMRVARNAAIDVARRRRSDTRAEQGVPDRAVGSDGAKAEIESVMAGIRELPEAQRTALLMRELAGHSYREIAALLEVDEAAVHGLIARARISLRSYREAYEMSCAAARAALAAEPDGRRRDRTVRRHVRMCPSCRAYKRALRGDARALRALSPDPAVSVASGGALFGGLAAKGALIGGTVAQVTAACAVSVCAIGGIVLAAPHSGQLAVGGVRASRGAAAHVAGAHRRPNQHPTAGEPALGTLAIPLPGAGDADAGAGGADRAAGRARDRPRRASGHSIWTRSHRRVRSSHAGPAAVSAPAPVAAQLMWGSQGYDSSGASPARDYPRGHGQGAAAQHADQTAGYARQASDPRNGGASASTGDPSVRGRNGQSSGFAGAMPNEPAAETRSSRAGSMALVHRGGPRRGLETALVPRQQF